MKILVRTPSITRLRLRLMQRRSRQGWSLSNRVALLRMNLFTHPQLHASLNKPLAVPPDRPDLDKRRWYFDVDRHRKPELRSLPRHLQLQSELAVESAQSRHFGQQRIPASIQFTPHALAVAA